MEKDGVKVTGTRAPNGGVDLYITCAECGEPLTVVNEYGMFCKNLCGYERSKAAATEMGAIFDRLVSLFDG